LNWCPFFSLAVFQLVIPYWRFSSPPFKGNFAYERGFPTFPFFPYQPFRRARSARHREFRPLLSEDVPFPVRSQVFFGPRPIHLNSPILIGGIILMCFTRFFRFLCPYDFSSKGYASRPPFDRTPPTPSRLCFFQTHPEQQSSLVPPLQRIVFLTSPPPPPSSPFRGSFFLFVSFLARRFLAGLNIPSTPSTFPLLN